MGIKNWLFGTPTPKPTTLLDLGYIIVEHTPEASVYQKEEVYGTKRIDIHLSGDCVPIVSCYDFTTGKAMALTYDELRAVTYTIKTKMITDWDVIFIGE